MDHTTSKAEGMAEYIWKDWGIALLWKAFLILSSVESSGWEGKCNRDYAKNGIVKITLQCTGFLVSCDTVAFGV